MRAPFTHGGGGRQGLDARAGRRRLAAIAAVLLALAGTPAGAREL